MQKKPVLQNIHRDAGLIESETVEDILERPSDFPLNLKKVLSETIAVLNGSAQLSVVRQMPVLVYNIEPISTCEKKLQIILEGLDVHRLHVRAYSVDSFVTLFYLSENQIEYLAQQLCNAKDQHIFYKAGYRTIFFADWKVMSVGHASISILWCKKLLTRLSKGSISSPDTTTLLKSLRTTVTNIISIEDDVPRVSKRQKSEEKDQSLEFYFSCNKEQTDVTDAGLILYTLEEAQALIYNAWGFIIEKGTRIETFWYFSDEKKNVKTSEQKAFELDDEYVESDTETAENWCGCEVIGFEKWDPEHGLVWKILYDANGGEEYVIFCGIPSFSSA